MLRPTQAPVVAIVQLVQGGAALLARAMQPALGIWNWQTWEVDELDAVSW